MLKLILAITLVLLITGCTDRPETPEYFTRVTGIGLCPDAKVKNINAADPSRSPGFDSIYVVHVSASRKCINETIKQIARKIGKSCDYSNNCSGTSNNGDFYNVEWRGQSIVVTHST